MYYPTHQLEGAGMYYPPYQLDGLGAARRLAYLTPSETSSLEKTVDGLVAKGYPRRQAVGLASRAVARVRRRHPRHPGSGLSGLGDATLDSVIAKAREIQDQHQGLINLLPLATTVEAQLPIKNDLYGLRTDWTNWGLSAVGVQFPYELDKTNPAHAVIVAVRDDIANTIDLIENKRTAEAIQKQIERIKEIESSVPFMGPQLPGIPGPKDTLKEILKMLLLPVGIALGGILALKAAKVF